MRKRGRGLNSRFTSGEAGQALILILVFILLGSLTIIPTLTYMTTALKSGVSYENNTKEFFTADAGIENGLWRIKYDFMGPNYDPYDFHTTWIYETDPVNNLTAEVSVQNVWLPSNVTLDSLGLTPAAARAIIESEKLVITGTSTANPGEPYHIKIDFTPAEGDNLTIKSIGIWLPQGFTYNTHSCLLFTNPFSSCYPDSENVSTVPGGQTLIWSYFAPYPLFTAFPNLETEDGTMTIDFTFTYTPPASDPTQMPVAIAWALTAMDPSCPNLNDVPIAWDTDTRIYKITSLAGDTNIQAYSSKLQLRNLDNAIAGDYAAIGNSLMNNPSGHIYTTLLPSSDSTLSTNPADADVLYAYLYWSGFRNDSVLFSDTCSGANLTSSWQNGGDWAFESLYYFFNYYRGQHIGTDSRRYLTMSNNISLEGYTSGTTAEISWRQSVSALSDIFYDDCSSLDNWNNGAAWEVRSNQYFRAKSATAEDNAARLLTMKSSQNLSGYNLITVSWDQWVSGAAEAGDGLDFAFYNGSTWSDYTQAFRGNIGSTPVNKSYTIPVDFGSEYLTNGFMIKFKLVGFTGSVYCNIDNIKITPSYTTADGLDFAISANGGNNWSSNIQAFRGNIGASWSTFTCNLTGQYLTSSNFKLRFYLVGMGGSQEYANIDDIKIIARPPDTAITFSINDEQVYLDAGGNPQAGAQPLTAFSGSIIVNESWGGYSYACNRDVSKLVKKYPVVAGEQHHTGNAKYTVGDVQANTGAHVSYAGWSLIIIYGSPQTAGHYLYLYDVFSFNPQSTNLDFDYDGQPGGDIAGFRFPEPIRDKYGVITENVAARLAAFVGEGDDWLYGAVPNTDCVKVTGQQSGNSTYLSNTASPSNNVWNSASYPIATEVGIDIDTFQISWSSSILTPNDTRLHLDMYSGQDAWNLIYFILSIRSQTVTRGTEYYIVGGQ